MRLQSSHTRADRGLHAYLSPPCAVQSLIAIEGEKIPRRLWEPAAGDGTDGPASARSRLPRRSVGYRRLRLHRLHSRWHQRQRQGERRATVELLLIRFLARARRSAGVTVPNRERAAAASANRQLRSQSAEQAWTP